MYEKVSTVPAHENYQQKNLLKFAQLKKNDYFCNRLRKVRAFSSAGLEHLPYKQRVGGSNPSTPTTLGSFQSGQMGQTVNLLLLASVVRIHHYPRKSCSHMTAALFYFPQGRFKNFLPPPSRKDTAGADCATERESRRCRVEAQQHKELTRFLSTTDQRGFSEHVFMYFLQERALHGIIFVSLPAENPSHKT